MSLSAECLRCFQPETKQDKSMKTHLMLSLALTGLTIATAQAQAPETPGGRGPGGPGGRRPQGPPPAEAVAQLSKRYAALAAFDADKNGKLETAELEKVAAAIDDGSLEMGPPGGRPGRPPGGPEGKPEGGPPPGGPEGAPAGKPPGKMIAAGAAKLYEALAPYDADQNGSLDETEQAAAVKAMEDGTLKLPRPGGRGPGGPGAGGQGGRGPGGPGAGGQGGRGPGGRGPGRPPGGQ